MKKWLMLLVIGLALFSCKSDDNNTKDVIGKWRLYSSTESGFDPTPNRNLTTIFENDIYLDFGSKLTVSGKSNEALSLNNGNYPYYLENSSYWNSEILVVNKNDAAPFMKFYRGDTLVLSRAYMDGNTLKLTKE